MTTTHRRLRTRFRSASLASHALAALLLSLLATLVVAQDLSCPTTSPVEQDPLHPLLYPKTSDRYAVTYKLGAGKWQDTNVYISYYGLTHASPFLPFSQYTLEARNAKGIETAAGTSMSFVSIPVPAAGVDVAINVTKLWGEAFANPAIRPSAKGIPPPVVMSDGSLQFTIKTSTPFAGEQFVLWWDGTTTPTENGRAQALAIFLDPVYAPPSGFSNVLKVYSASDLVGISSVVDTLDFETPMQIETTGDRAFVVPAHIRTIYLAPGAWVQGKLRFEETGTGCFNGIGCVRTIYGPGVLDVSRFHYDYRHCGAGSGHVDEGYPAISFAPLPAGSPQIHDQYVIDGIIVSDTNFYATDLLDNATLNNVKTLGWNGNNDGLELGTIVRASNVFVRSGDDSLKMWGSYATVKNATVWQNYNGGVVNLGWFDNSPGENSLIEGLFIVDTDWRKPDAPLGAPVPLWEADPAHSIDDLNNAVIASEMVPGTQFGLLHPSLYRDIHVEETDPLQVLLSLKIAPPRTGNIALTSEVNLKTPSVLNLDIEHLVAPQSLVKNLIGFQTLPAGYTFPGDPNDSTDPPQSFSSDYTMRGSMNVGLYDVEVTPPGTRLENASLGASVGNVYPHGANVNIAYGDALPAPSGPQWYSAWTAPQGYDFVPSAGMDRASVRMIVRPTISGTMVRVKIENTVGQSEVRFSAAYVGKIPDAQAGPPLPAALASNTQLTFNGSHSLTLAPGKGAYSDPLPLDIQAFGLYAVSLDVATAKDISGHLLGIVTNYMASGSDCPATDSTGCHAGDLSGSAFSAVAPDPDKSKGPTFPVYWVAAFDVASAVGTGAVVALGDSITDGACSNETGDLDRNDVVPDVYHRWTDLLASRLLGTKAVANEGIAGNKVTGGVADAVGQPALVRIANDVLGREGATHVILLEGTNDLAAGIQAEQLIAADERIVDAAHGIGLNVIGATILPRGGSGTWSFVYEAQRQLLNNWIRYGGYFDGVIDFDALMQGPTDPTTKAPTLLKKWSCYDGIHPNADGYAAMAGAIDLGLFATPLRNRLASGDRAGAATGSRGAELARRPSVIIQAAATGSRRSGAR